MSIEFTVICDQCQRVVDASSRSAADARRRALAEGSLIRAGRRDVCADHKSDVLGTGQ